MRTNKAAFERQKRVSAILNKRLVGHGLAEIAAAENCTVQNISQLIQRALAAAPKEAVANLRLMEALRLDDLQSALWERALGGDLAVIDKVLAIMRQRSRLLGLDRQPNVYGDSDGDGDPGVVKIEIVGNPEPQRMKWMEGEIRRLRALTEGSAPPSTTLN